MKNIYKPILAVLVISLAALLLVSCAGGNFGNSFFPGRFSVPRFLYLVGDNDIGGFNVNADTGVLSKIAGSPFGSIPCPDHAVANSAGKFIFVADCDGGVWVFAIGTDGALTDIAGSPFFSSSCEPEVPAITPDGRFLYISDDCDLEITAFSIGSDGSLTELSGSPFSLNGNVDDSVGLTVTPDGRYLYVGVYDGIAGNGGIEGFVIGSDGSLTDVDSGNIAAAPGAGSESPVLGMDPYGRFVYAVDSEFDTVYSFQINSGTGALGVAKSGPTGLHPRGVAVSPNGHVLVTANGGDLDNGIEGNVSAFAVDVNTGALTQVPGSPYGVVSDPRNPNRIAIDPTGGWVYVSMEDAGECCGLTDGDGGLVVFKIDYVHGALIPGPGPFNTNRGPEGIVFVH